MKFMKETFNFKKSPNPVFVLPYILLVLHRLGGSAKNQEVVGELVKYFDLSDKILDEKTPKLGIPVFGNQVAWGRSYLVSAGYIDNEERGVWKITEKARNKVEELESLEKDKLDVFRHEVIKLMKEKGTVRRKKTKEKETEISKTSYDEEAPVENEQDQLKKMLEKDLEKIKKLDPYAFERLCVQILKSFGYKDVKETQKSRDGGFDGIGFLSVGLIRFKVIFQAKRFTDGKVSENDINALAGVKGKTGSEKALFITTSDFTRDADKAALEYGIELIDGKRLMEILYEKDIGYSKNYDEEFFKNI